MVYLVVKNTDFWVGKMTQRLGTLIAFAKGLSSIARMYMTVQGSP